MQIDYKKLDRGFNPQCIVVIGDKDKLNWLRRQSNFKGKLYSVQVNPDTITKIEALGIKNYTSILDVPEPVDLAIVAVSRALAPRILDECIQKQVAAVHFFTAGFTETNTPEGKELENSLIQKANQANLHLIGPNCMGIFNPQAGVIQEEGQYHGVSGPVGLISQSGTHAVTFALEGHLQGVDIAKSVSFGNGVVLDSVDFLEYFSTTADIEVIGMYLEGTKDGPRFLSALKKVIPQKPVVIWKGGRTGEGERAIASHTASLAIKQTIWDAAMHQCGAISVTNMEAFIDTIKALSYLPPIRGNRVGIFGGSGGQAVALADGFAEAGLDVPLLTAESYKKLESFFRVVGASYLNPIDPGVNRREMGRIMDILEQDANVDIVVQMIMVRGGFRTVEDLWIDVQNIIKMREKSSKPIMVILFSSTLKENELAREIANKLHQNQIPTFISVERGALALKNAVDYYSYKQGL